VPGGDTGRSAALPASGRRGRGRSCSGSAGLLIVAGLSPACQVVWYIFHGEIGGRHAKYKGPGGAERDFVGSARFLGSGHCVARRGTANPTLAASLEMEVSTQDVPLLNEDFSERIRAPATVSEA
jgi:hypothetical protein